MLRLQSPFALALCLAAGLSACASPHVVQGASADAQGVEPLTDASVGAEDSDDGAEDSDDGAAGDGAEPEDAEQAAEKLAQAIEDLTFKLEQSRMERESTEIQVELDLQAARSAVEDARDDLNEKRMALEVYAEVESKQELDTSKLSLDRASNRAMEAAQELAELQSMYDVEEFAEKTKELVISRGERNLAMTQRQLELQNRSHTHLLDWTVPKKRRGLERAAAQAERKLARAARQLEKAELDAEKRLRAADHAVVKLERELEEKRDEVDA